MKNPLNQLLNKNNDPQQILQRITGTNPQAMQVLQSLNGKSSVELRQMAENLARQNGTSVEAVARSLGLLK